MMICCFRGVFKTNQKGLVPNLPFVHGFFKRVNLSIKYPQEMPPTQRYFLLIFVYKT